MLVLIVDNHRSDNTSSTSDVRIVDHVQLPAAISCDRNFEEWIVKSRTGDVYQIDNSYRIVKLGVLTG